MCTDTDRTANRRHYRNVSDLQPGDRYRTPEGDTLLVTNAGSPMGTAPGEVTVVNLRTGALVAVSGSTKLGHDRIGRLYASRYLNPPVPDEVVDLGTPPQAPPDDRTYTYNPDDPEGLNTTTMGDI